MFLQLSLCRSHRSCCATLASCLSFAAGLKRSFWIGCIKAATVICQQIFSIWRFEIRFWNYNFPRRCALFSVFCNSVGANRIGMAASRLLLASAACVMSFAAGSRKLFWTGCMKAAKWMCQQIISFLAVAHKFKDV